MEYLRTQRTIVALFYCCFSFTTKLSPCYVNKTTKEITKQVKSRGRLIYIYYFYKIYYEMQSIFKVAEQTATLVLHGLSS